jgi:hypothetical protein
LEEAEHVAYFVTIGALVMGAIFIFLRLFGGARRI